MKVFRVLFAVGAMATAFLLTSTGVVFGKPEYSKKEKKPCVTCHVTAKSKELNDVGKYYHEKKTLEGAPAPKK
ncbi:MAG: hypothetical protein IT161_17295 [Bryobacterales bacterium]|nr:hypothetical protein [Bryobacterales bacterium]